MSIELDSLIRKGKALEKQIEQLKVELTQVREEVATLMQEQREYYGTGVVAKKWARVRWTIDKELLLDELHGESLNYFKEVVFTKDKLDAAVRAGHLPPRLYGLAVKKTPQGWNVSLSVLDTVADEVAWETETEEG